VFLPWSQANGTSDNVARFDAEKVFPLAFPPISQLASSFLPRIPDHRSVRLRLLQPNSTMHLRIEQIDSILGIYERIVGLGSDGHVPELCFLLIGVGVVEKACPIQTMQASFPDLLFDCRCAGLPRNEVVFCPY
jgi:hypothetical protein